MRLNIKVIFISIIFICLGLHTNPNSLLGWYLKESTLTQFNLLELVTTQICIVWFYWNRVQCGNCTSKCLVIFPYDFPFIKKKSFSLRWHTNCAPFYHKIKKRSIRPFASRFARSILSTEKIWTATPTSSGKYKPANICHALDSRAKGVTYLSLGRVAC